MATGEKRKPKIKKLPKLVQEEKLELQNIMLRVALEQQRIEKYEACINTAKKELRSLEERLDAWNYVFNIKLKEQGFDISQVEIDAETGEIKPLNAI
ncbi:hypothetical protein KAR91_04890 [Candidatus Pacearchaeota archaeon]|nr:hypothetical protein [Candidatus Pacearchaeota archaeon]